MRIYVSPEMEALDVSFRDMNTAKRALIAAENVVKAWEDAVELAEEGKLDRMRQNRASARLQAEAALHRKSAACTACIEQQHKWNETCAPEDWMPVDLKVEVSPPEDRDAT